MASEENINALITRLNEGFGDSTLIKATLSNKRRKDSDLNNVFIRPVVIRGEAVLQFVSGMPQKTSPQITALRMLPPKLKSCLPDRF